jgi:hypothetical protein
MNVSNGRAVALSVMASLFACSSADTFPAQTDGGTATVTGCAALQACCPNLPSSQVPSECLTVVQEGTALACQDSLAGYRSAGYCEPIPSASAPSASIMAVADENDGTSGGSTTCLGKVTWSVGTPEAPIASGTALEGGTEQVTCTVASAAGGTYALDLQVAVDGITFMLTGSPSSARVVLQGEGKYFNWNDCSVTLTTQTPQPIAPGKIWGSLSCPSAGSASGCPVTATLLFENCAE